MFISAGLIFVYLYIYICIFNIFVYTFTFKIFYICIVLCIINPKEHIHSPPFIHLNEPVLHNFHVIFLRSLKF